MVASSRPRNFCHARTTTNVSTHPHNHGGGKKELKLWGMQCGGWGVTAVQNTDWWCHKRSCIPTPAGVRRPRDRYSTDENARNCPRRDPTSHLRGLICWKSHLCQFYLYFLYLSIHFIYFFLSFFLKNLICKIVFFLIQRIIISHIWNQIGVLFDTSFHSWTYRSFLSDDRDAP